jgi:hypothetical protein
MGKLHLSKWWGLYALVPLMIALMVIDADGAMSQTWHLILLAGIAFVICALALSWVDNNPRLVERAGLGLRDDPAAPRLYTIVEDEWESVPIRHSGIDNGFEEADD